MNKPKVSFQLSKNDDRAVRDFLYDQITINGQSEYKNSLFQRISNWKEEKNRRYRRLFWCLSVIHTKKELEEIINDKLDSFNISGLNDGIAISGNSIVYDNAGLCDVIIFNGLNLGLGEAFGRGHFDSEEEGRAFGSGLGHSRYDGYSDGEGGWYVVWDTDLSD